MKRKKIQDKKKVLFSFLALALTAAIMLTGTFAWQSISQEALNEIGENGLNVGGRLHDDFDGEIAFLFVIYKTIDGIDAFLHGAYPIEGLHSPFQYVFCVAAGCPAQLSAHLLWKRHPVHLVIPEQQHSPHGLQ